MSGSGETASGSVKQASFPKKEKLCDQNITASLFKAGQKFLSPPFTFIWLNTTLKEDTPFQVLISVSKSKFPRAVDRNKVKRLIRESFRLHKQGLTEHLRDNKQQLAFAIIYSSKKITTFNDTEKKIKVALSTFIDIISDKEQNIR